MALELPLQDRRYRGGTLVGVRTGGCLALHTTADNDVPTDDATSNRTSRRCRAVDCCCKCHGCHEACDSFPRRHQSDCAPHAPGVARLRLKAEPEPRLRPCSNSFRHDGRDGVCYDADTGFFLMRAPLTPRRASSACGIRCAAPPAPLPPRRERGWGASALIDRDGLEA